MLRRRDSDMLTCRQVAAVLQSFLDGETDEVTARRVAKHLEACRRCGLELQVFSRIKDALRQRRPQDPDAVARLGDFARRIAENPSDAADA